MSLVKKSIKVKNSDESKNKGMTRPKKLSKNYVSWMVFLFSISVVLISFVPVIFPGILVIDTIKIPGVDEVGPDPFEPGLWAGGVFFANIVIFSLLILYFKKKLPKSILSTFSRLFSFEISEKIALISLLVLLIIYTSTSFGELSYEEDLEDYQGVKNRLQTWSIEQAFSSFEPHVRYFLLDLSMMVFGNYKVLPLLASIALLITTYFVTKEISQKRFAGIVAVIILMQSSVFLTYDTTVSYTNFWILFYLISLFAVYKFWPLSPVSYLLSISAKPLTVVFLPMSIFFILRSQISKKQKILTAGVTAVIIIAGGVAVMGSSLSPTQTEEEFNAKEFWMGFTSFSYQLRFDGLVILFMIPLMIGLFIASKNGIKHGESIMILIAGMLLIAPILTGITNQTNQPYRFVPLVVFFAMGVGVLLSKRQA
jgi:hypothetical protein